VADLQTSWSCWCGWPPRADAPSGQCLAGPACAGTAGAATDVEHAHGPRMRSSQAALGELKQRRRHSRSGKHAVTSANQLPPKYFPWRPTTEGFLDTFCQINSPDFVFAYGLNLANTRQCAQ